MNAAGDITAAGDVTAGSLRPSRDIARFRHPKTTGTIVVRHIAWPSLTIGAAIARTICIARAVATARPVAVPGIAASYIATARPAITRSAVSGSTIARTTIAVPRRPTKFHVATVFGQPLKIAPFTAEVVAFALVERRQLRV